MAQAHHFLNNPIISLLRVKQWSKNAFVLAPLIFAYKPGRFGATDYFLLFFAWISFCLLSSSVYCLNDILDRESDRLHPRKCRRPIASGAVSVMLASVISIILVLTPFLCGLGIALSYPGLLIPLIKLATVGGLYVINNILYCTILRHREILDVFSIALGFVLRLLAGCFALQTEPSHWLLLCGFNLALLLGFGKRRMELAQQNESQKEFRLSLQFYSTDFLNILLAISATITLTTYMLYSISPDTIAIHNTKNLIYTSAFVIFGVFRYISAALSGKIDGPDELLFNDKLFLVNIILWGVVSLIILLI